MLEDVLKTLNRIIQQLEIIQPDGTQTRHHRQGGTMTQWEYCEIDFDEITTWVYFYDEAGENIDDPAKHPLLV